MWRKELGKSTIKQKTVSNLQLNGSEIYAALKKDKIIRTHKTEHVSYIC